MGTVVLPVVLALLLAQEDSVERMIEGLRSDQVEVREKASKDLLAKGIDVVAILEPLRTDPDPEVAARAQELLDQNAKNAFERVATAIDGIRTLRVRITGSGAICRDVGIDRLTTSATILIGLIDKASHVARTERRGGDPEPYALVSDGFDISGPLDPLVSWSTPGNFKEALLSMLFLVGEEPLRATVRRWYTLRKLSDQRPNPKRSCRVSELAVRKENARRETLSFRVEGPEVPQGAATVQLTYDAATCAPVKRVLTTFDVEGRPADFVETFEEFAINADIPEENFKLPEEKK